MTQAGAQASRLDTPAQGCEYVRMRGRVQGVGMRPAIAQLAQQQARQGWVRNDGRGVEFCLQASAAEVDAFIMALQQALPPLARIDHMERRRDSVSDCAAGAFVVAPSRAQGQGAWAHADLATCAACLTELREPSSRRQNYPFISCSACGPRFSIQSGLPWDRSQTAMAAFPFCPACRADYEDWQNRRFHAEASACPVCGPSLSLLHGSGDALPAESTDAVLAQVCDCLAQGGVVAIKGIGGFHLACDARDERAVARVRTIKARPHKALAVMVVDMAAAQDLVELGERAATLLRSAAAPIVLLRQRPDGRLAAGIAPGLARLGVMLPANPLQVMLLERLDFPLVMTSGNVSGQPPALETADALAQLGGQLDMILSHDRPIHHRLDDSLVQVVDEQVQTLRLGRGYAPLQAAHELPRVQSVLAMGGHMKSSFALLRERDWLLFQHHGDLDSPANRRAYEQSIGNCLQMFQAAPRGIAVDRHPGYYAHEYGQQLARQLSLPVIKVQHHHAHAVAQLLANSAPPEQGPWLALCFDGLGYGDDGQLWGGEFLQVDYQSYRRLGCWRPLRLIGGAAAMREPWRVLFSIIAQLGDWEDFEHAYPLTASRLNWPLSTAALAQVLDRPGLSPWSSAAARHFDALAWLLGLVAGRLGYDGQAAMLLEALVDPSLALGVTEPLQAFENRDGITQLDWRPLWRAVFARCEAGAEPTEVAGFFHRALAQLSTAMAGQLHAGAGMSDTLVLSGGVFQNPSLYRASAAALRMSGLQALPMGEVPCNDGGLALGQACIAAHSLAEV